MPASLEDYDVINTIGSGSYGVCRKICRKKDGRVLAWKEMDYGSMSETEKVMLVSEVNLLRELRHKHIVRYYDRIIDRSNATLYIVMEYCEGGDLGHFIAKHKKDGKPIFEEFVWKICAQIISALKECHSRTKNGKSVLHRDLKPANVFLDSNENVKLGDFGLARVLNHETSFAKTMVGTPYYMSPEQMNYLSYNEKSDIWSLGCLMYELCALRPPFTATSSRELQTKICLGRFSRIPHRYSNELNVFISCLLRIEELKRPTINDLMLHPKIVHLLKPETDNDKDSQCDGGSGKDSGEEQLIAVSHKEATLKEKERSLKELEWRLKNKEKELSAREVAVTLREKIADEKLERLSRKQIPSRGLQPLATYNNFVKNLQLGKPKQNRDGKENEYSEVDKLAIHLERKCKMKLEK